MSRPSSEVRGAVAVVTGATRGIGRATAEALGHEGARIVVVGRTSDHSADRRLPGTVEEVVAQLEAEGVEALAVQADLADADQTQQVIERTLDWHGRCDILVNNAAYTSNGPIMSVPWRRWQTAFRIQVVAPMQLCHGFIPGMLERSCGRVLNVSSGASRSVTPGLALYAASKRALEAWSDSMSRELAEGGIAVNTLRVDRIVATEGFEYVRQTQGEEVATGGGGMSGVMSTTEAAAHLVWLLRQPTDWTGHTFDFEDIAAAGGPPVPARD